MKFLPTREVMSSDDILTVCRAAREIGITHFKLTGGEPLLRHDLCEIIDKIKSLSPDDISLTTNGILLEKRAMSLKEAGVDRVTISLDTLKSDRFDKIVGWKGKYRLQDVLNGIKATDDTGYQKIKINTVVMAGINDDEVISIAELTRNHPWTVRFIEYMPLGQSYLTEQYPQRTQHLVIRNHVLKNRLNEYFGEMTAMPRMSEPGVGPAEIYQIPGHKGLIGFISAMSQPFCEQCNRLRLTSNGDLRACLFDGGEVNILEHLNQADSCSQIIDSIKRCVQSKPMRHSGRGNRAMSQMGG